MLASVISAGVLVGSVVALYFVKGAGARLALVAVFTQIFGGVLVCVTRAKKVEIFAAMAA